MSKLIYGWGNHHKNANWVSFYQMIVLLSVEVLISASLKSEEYFPTKRGDPACKTQCSDPVERGLERCYYKMQCLKQLVNFEKEFYIIPILNILN